jgi:hypothetical protein
MHVGHTQRTTIPATVLFAAAALGSPGAAVAQAMDTVVVAAGPRYEAGAVHQLVLGRHYRDLWTEPFRVPVLDLEGFAGGLTPLRRGGGLQTRSLKLRGADGREYTFRSVDKDPSPILDSLLWNTVVDDLIQDGVSSEHPLAALVVAPLLDAVGVLHAEPSLRIMPDDPALGEFRGEFAGVLGLIEEKPDENADGSPSFGGATRVVGSDRLMERIDEGPADQVDARAFLTARIMDLLLGDWDRHRDQWRWATLDEGDRRSWLPIPRDRDQAFSRFDGLAFGAVRVYKPQLVTFEARVPDIVGLHWNGRELDRRFLSGMERTAWDSIGAWIQERLTDDVIDGATRRLPPRIYDLNGHDLAATLRWRRDHLRDIWTAFYELLARDVDVVGTDADEVAVVDRTDAGSVVVTIRDGQEGGRPYFDRRFPVTETREIRLYLKGGDDRVVVDGSGGRGITVRVIGGRGDDVFETAGGSDGLRLYDDEGTNVVRGDGPSIDTRPFDEWVWSVENRDQPRDWGQRWVPLLWSSYSSDLGPFLGGGTRLERYGFRARPYRTAVEMRAGVAPAHATGRAEVAVRWRRENSPVFASVKARASGLDVIHWYGLGNATSGGGGAFHAVDARTASLSAGVGMTSHSGLTAEVGLAVSAFTASGEDGRYFATVRDTLYGAAGFGQLGVRAHVTVDPYSGRPTRTLRVRGEASGEIVPATGDVETPFGATEGEISALLHPSGSAASVLVRGGGRKVWGRFPWQEAAFLGGPGTLSGWAEQRFAGDASVWLSGEARLRVLRALLLVPADVGVFGVADAGRVFIDGSSPGGWHTSLGGGVWITPAGQPSTIRVGIANSVEATKVFASVGLPY